MTMVAREPMAIRLTAEEYDALPPNSRVELVDGVLQVMTPPTRRHQEIIDKLKHVLERLCPPEFCVVREQEIRISGEHRRNPDLMVVRRAVDDLDRYGFVPADVLLAIEVVSPGTETIDRLHKPAEYAQARIPHYWRVEPKPLVVVHPYTLGETGPYLEGGLFKEGDTVVAPGLSWATVAVADIAP
jgi:Uma2 family endonuclease